MKSDPIKSVIKIYRDDTYNKEFSLEFFKEDLDYSDSEDVKTHLWTPTTFMLGVGESLKVLCGEAMMILLNEPPELPSVLNIDVEFLLQGIDLQAHTVFASNAVIQTSVEAQSERLLKQLVPQITEHLKNHLNPQPEMSE